ncbi:MAG: hypothetical protein RLZZ623_2277 [Actinomycetota bacterium]|jgi:uncharacterized protein (TIGR03086 family)
MAQRVPPVGDEQESLFVSLDRHRDVVLWKLEGLTDEQVRRPMTPSGTTLLGLVKHLAAVEYGWFCETFGRSTEPLPFDEADRNADLRIEPHETTADIVAFYGRARAAANESIAELSPDDVGTAWFGDTVSMRWVLIHMIEETARHVGHMDILRELLDGATGDHDRSNDEGASAQFRAAAQGFTDRARAVADGAWDNPAPCEGWVARDIVRHMVEWMPALLRAGAGIELPAGPPVDEQPLAAWLALTAAIQAVLDDPETSSRQFVHEQAGTHSLENAISMFIVGDIVLHTWDLARATGGDERLDPEVVHRMLVGMEPLDEMLRASGQYGPRVDVPADADEQTRLIAFVGRRP